jgi:HEPN domain-containing protein
LPPLAWLGVGTSRVVRARARARGLRNAPERAVREARKRLAQAERHAEAGDPRSFYAEVARSLREVLEARTGEPMGSLTYDQLRQRLDELGMSEDLARLVIDELEGGDYARFSASGVTQEEMRHCLDRCRALIARLDRFSPAEQAS